MTKGPYNIFKGTKIALAYLGLRKPAPTQIHIEMTVNG